ncbi:hypothetical protein [Thermomonospora cellulosilytica]|uniref:Uncharacterized protein n=1 Tax=Thermomonospora cellulosilytica TaxID=1411118 RepID=A0A7W3R8I3_9ACTN|nr:hypothetical protein [Thermomonospora cellulosilytica]MBA9003692.1 hypothetical protein [Thermomonospora cellulosilytica]
MIDIATDLREQAARYEASARATLEAAPAPLPDLEEVRAKLLADLADVDRRIAARRDAERRHAHLMDVAQKLNALAAETGFTPPGGTPVVASVVWDDLSVPEVWGLVCAEPAPIGQASVPTRIGPICGMPIEEEPCPHHGTRSPAGNDGVRRLSELTEPAPLGEAVAGQAVTATRPQEVPPPPVGGRFPAAEDVVDGPGETGPQGGVNEEGQQP